MSRFLWAAGIVATVVLPSAAIGSQASSVTVRPDVFSPGIVSGPSNDGAPTFSPDGDLLLFERAYARWTAIFESRRTGGAWSRPVLASFSGPASDQQPAFSPDGRYVIFASSRIRPALRSGEPPDVFTHLWRVDRTSTGWSNAVELPVEVNLSDRVFKPSVASNGDLYFMAATTVRPIAPNWRLYRSAWRDGKYEAAQPLPFSNIGDDDVDPFIAPDQAYLLFSSRTRAEPSTTFERLYFVPRIGNGWGTVRPLRYDGDDWGADDGEAQVSADGSTLFFSSARSQPFDRSRTRDAMIADLEQKELWDNSNSNVWMLPLLQLLEANDIELPVATDRVR